MSQNLVPRPQAGLVPARQQRSLDRSTAAAVSAVRSDAVVQAARVAAIGYVAHVAMSEVAFLAQHHVALVGVVPLADQGLQWIRDAATMGMAQVVADMARR